MARNLARNAIRVCWPAIAQSRGPRSRSATGSLRRPPAALYAAGVRVEDLRRTQVPELQRLFVEEGRELPAGGLTALKCDPRAGARAIAEKIERRNHKAQAEGRR